MNIGLKAQHKSDKCSMMSFANKGINTVQGSL